MNGILTRILDMSVQGSMVIGAVLLIRFLLRRSPKIFSYSLWLVVLFRLLCPITIEAPVALVPKVDVATEYYRAEAQPLPVNVEAATVPETVPQVQPDLQYIPVNQSTPPSRTTESAEVAWLDICRYVWLIGVAGFAIYSGISYFLLRRKLIGVVYQGGVYLSDHISAPFVMGLFRPGIYLPSSLKERERSYIIAHEQCHIRRGDHVVKVFAFVALSIHWFNPLVWLMYNLLCKDMEMCCDEAVLRKLGSDLRADYAASLLRFTTGKGEIGMMPLAFGEGDTKGRIQNLSKWKKPKLWLLILTALLVIGLTVLLIVSPADEAREAAETRQNQVEQPKPGGVSVEEAFQSVLSHAGFDPDSTLYTSSLNATAFAQSNGQTHLPVFKFNTRDELDQFMSAYADGLSMTESYEEVPSFASVAERYDEDLFAENSVLLVYIRAIDSSCRYRALGVRAGSSRLDIRVGEIKDDHHNPGDITGWFLTMAVPDSMVRGVDRVDATLEDARTAYVPRIVEGVADGEENLYYLEASVPGTDFSVLGEKVYKAIEADWNTYDRMEYTQRLLSSRLYGCVSIPSDSWQQMQADIGLPLDNPLADISWLTATDIYGGISTDASIPHIETTVLATESTGRQISQLTVTAGYNTQGIRVVLSAVVQPEDALYTAGIAGQKLEQEQTTTASGIPVLLTYSHEDVDYTDLTACWLQDEALYSLRLVGDAGEFSALQDTMASILQEI